MSDEDPFLDHKRYKTLGLVQKSQGLRFVANKLDVRQTDEDVFGHEATKHIIYDTLRLLGFDTKSRYVEYFVQREHKGLVTMIDAVTRRCGDEYTVSNPAGEFTKTYGLWRSILRKHFLGVHRLTGSCYSGPHGIYDSFGRRREYRAITKPELNLIMAKSKAIACFESGSSTMLKIDIDDHENTFCHSLTATEVLLKVLEDFRNTEPAFIERSIQNGGWHVYYRFNRILTDEERIAYQENFKNRHGFSIEVSTQNKALKLPMSATYEAGIIENLDDIRSGMADYVRLHPYQSVVEMIKDVTARRKKSLPVRMLLDLIRPERAVELQIPGETDVVTPETAVEEIPKAPLFVRQHLNPMTDSDPDRFLITAGNRLGGNRAMKRLCLHLVMKGTGADAFFDATIANNRGSKDLSSWPEERIRKECEGLYSYYERNLDVIFSRLSNFQRIRKSSELYLNAQHLTPELKKLARSYARAAFRKFVMLNGRTSEKWMRETYKAFVIFSREIAGRVIWESMNPRKVADGKVLTLNKKVQLERGYTFPRKYLTALKEHYDLTVDILPVFRFLTVNGLLFWHYRHNTAGYTFGENACPRQWELYARGGTIQEKLEAGLRLATKGLLSVHSAADFEKQRRKIILKTLVKGMHLSESHADMQDVLGKDRAYYMSVLLDSMTAQQSFEETLVLGVPYSLYYVETFSVLERYRRRFRGRERPPDMENRAA